MNAEQRAVALAEALRKVEAFSQKCLRKRGVMGPDDAVEVSFRILPRVIVRFQEAIAPSAAPSPAEITSAEWEAIMRPMTEENVQFIHYTGNRRQLSVRTVQRIQSRLKKLRVNGNQPAKYSSILVDGLTVNEVNGYLLHLKLDLRLRTFPIREMGKRSHAERKINYVVLVREPVSQEE